MTTAAVFGVRTTQRSETLRAALVALVFGLLNAIIRPVLWLLTLPFLILTLGLFTFVLNAFMLWMTSATSDMFGLRFNVDGFGAAFLGALVITIVSLVLSLLVGPQRHKRVSRG